MHNIIVIGTIPPCPRCKLLTKVVSAKVKELGLNAEVRHLSYTDEESKDFAKIMGLEAGTAKDVAKKLNIEIDVDKITKLINNKTLKQNYEYKEYNNCNWSYELDEFLRPYEKRAKEAGILMTPVLIIDGIIKHQGSIPNLSNLEKWLLELR